MAYERGVMYVQDARLKGVGATRHGPAARLHEGVHRRGTVSHRVLAYIAQTARSRGHHRLVHRDGDVRRDARRARRSADAASASPTREIRANLEARYGLDRPVLEQYTIYLGNMLRGDFGLSYTQQNRRVNDIIREHFPVSATLGILAIAFATFGGRRCGVR